MINFARVPHPERKGKLVPAIPESNFSQYQAMVSVKLDAATVFPGTPNHLSEFGGNVVGINVIANVVFILHLIELKSSGELGNLIGNLRTIQPPLESVPSVAYRVGNRLLGILQFRFQR